LADSGTVMEHGQTASQRQAGQLLLAGQIESVMRCRHKNNQSDSTYKSAGTEN